MIKILTLINVLSVECFLFFALLILFMICFFGQKISVLELSDRKVIFLFYRAVNDLSILILVYAILMQSCFFFSGCYITVNGFDIILNSTEVGFFKLLLLL